MSTTYAAFKLSVEKELDLEEEDFIQSAEFLEYTNKARRTVEAEVITIYEDYLLDNVALALVNGVSKYNLPSNIYARKIRSIVYNNGSLVYEILQIRGLRKFLERAFLVATSPTDYYQYIILNSATNGIQFEFSPPAKETSATNVVVWFLRKLPEITGTGTEYVDSEVPESLNYVYALVKGYCKQKENGGVMPEDAKSEILSEKTLLVETLTNAIPDDDNEVLKDMSHYDESS